MPRKSFGAHRCCTFIATVCICIFACGADSDPPALDAATRLGETIAVNTHYGTRGSVDRAALALLRRAGVKILRNDLDWALIEREPGNYDFSEADELVEAATAEQLRVWFILAYGNRLYGPDRAVLTDEGRRAFAAYAGAAAARYRGRHFFWEIWNEPNLPTFWRGEGRGPDPAAYASLIAATVPAVRQADPTATVIGGAVFAGFPDAVALLGGIPHLDFLDGIFALSVLPLLDGISAHFYRAGPPESVADEIAGIRQLMSPHDLQRPVYSGEWGYSTYDPSAPATGFNFLPAVSLDQQATSAARMLLYNFYLGVPVSVWFKDRDDANPSPGNIEHHWGLLFSDLTPKPAYYAVSTLSRLLGEGTVEQLRSFGQGTYMLTFDTPRGKVSALWSVQRARWRINLASSATRIVSRDGEGIDTLSLAERGVETGPSSGPFYIVGAATVELSE
ncbi:MAG: endo-1,4-beta-xylanase [Candidatus Binatia bacterium]|nr:endo-1,4-beta-xylanase [Candidatus Binatia bacterium]